MDDLRHEQAAYDAAEETAYQAMEETQAFRGPYFFLSNFYPTPIEFEGEVYPSTEYAYQAAKYDKDSTILVERNGKATEKRIRELIQEAKTPGQAKRLGRMPARKGWREARLQAMEDLLRQKFSDPELRQKLLNTGSIRLVESNWWGDRFWGACNGTGSNNLGKLLMKIRQELSQ